MRSSAVELLLKYNFCKLHDLTSEERLSLLCLTLRFVTIYDHRFEVLFNNFTVLFSEGMHKWVRVDLH